MSPDSGGRYRGGPRREEVLRRDQPDDTGRPSSASGRAADEAIRGQIVEEMRAVCARLQMGLAARLAAAGEALQQAVREGDKQIASAGRARERSLAMVGTRAAEEVIQIRSALDEWVEAAGGGAVSAPLEDLRLAPHPGLSAPVGVRVGRLCLPAGAVVNQDTLVPLVVPLLDQGNVAVWGDPTWTDGVVSTLLLRNLMAAAPGQLLVSWYDPGLRVVLAPFSDLRDSGLVAQSMDDPDEIEEHLEALAEIVSEVADMRAGVHARLGDLNVAAGQHVAPYRVLVLFDYPDGLNEEALSRVDRLARQGPLNGVHLVVAGRRETPVPAAFVIKKVSGDVVVTGISGLRVEMDELPSTNLIHEVCPALAERAKLAAAPHFNYAEILPPPELQWQGSSVNGVTITLGKSGTKLASFTLGDKLDQTHNVLVGGAVGQGKSNLLQVVIHDLAAHYSPTEVEMYLLDFKEGVEFSALAPSSRREYGIPHARVIGVESDRAFGQAVLAHLVAEFGRRAELFKAAGDLRDLAEYREARPHEPVPRIVCIIDEFQGLMTENDELAESTVELLNTLARKGRAYGIHLILASQTLSGIKALVTAEDSIFSQFAIRIALRTNKQESQVLFEPGNAAASELRYRGEAVLNRGTGAPEFNQRVIVAFATPDLLEAQRREWTRRFGRRPEPLVFEGGRLADYQGAHPGFLEVGVPVSLSQDPAGIRLSDDAGCHLAVIGDGGRDGREAIGVLHASIASAVRSPGKPLDVVILDLLGEEQRQVGCFDALVEVLGQKGLHARVVPRPTVAEYLVELSADLVSREESFDRRLMVVGAGLHRAIGLDRAVSLGGDAPVDALRRVVREGPMLGVHLVAWWANLASFRLQIEADYGTRDILRGFVFLRAPQDDVREIIGPFVDWTPQPLRGLFYDRSIGEEPRLVVPFRPLTAESLSYVLGVGP